jgi:hypothetical protein
MDKSKISKMKKIAFDVLLYTFLVICVFAVFITVLSKRDSDGAAEVFGYQMRVVTSDSMSESEFTDVSAYKIKDIPIRSMVFVKVMPDDPAKADEFYRSLKVGDVLTFRYVYTTQVTITHRITNIEEVEGGFKITLAGDNKNAENGQLVQVIDTSIPNNTNYVIGKVTGQAYLFGLLMSFLMQPAGMILLVIAPCFIIILLEVLKIVKVLDADKKKREQEEKKKTENELEELRSKIAALEKEKLNNISPETNEKSGSEDAED